MNGNMHLTGFCSEANETENLSSALDCSVFPDNRELFGNESNKKKTYSDLDLCYSFSLEGRSDVFTRKKHVKYI